MIADGFLPLLSEPALADRYQLIRYHKRGWVGSTRRGPPVSIADHAADAAALLDHLGLRPVHVAGHSSGAAVAAQLALDHPEHVRDAHAARAVAGRGTSLEAFFTQVEPALEAYASGDQAGALAIFMSAVSGLEWTSGSALLEEAVPGAVQQAIADADTFFDVELPAMTEWTFGREQAAAIHQPVLSVVGSETQPVVGGGRRVPALRAAAGRRMHNRGRQDTYCRSSVPSPSLKRWRSSSTGTRSAPTDPSAQASVT